MIGQVLDVLTQDLSIDTLGGALLGFRDYVNLKLTCKEFNIQIVKYWMFNINKGDYQLYKSLCIFGSEFLYHHLSEKQVERYIELFGYTHKDMGFDPLISTFAWSGTRMVMLKHHTADLKTINIVLYNEMYGYSYCGGALITVEYILQNYKVDVNYYLSHIAEGIYIPLLLKYGADVKIFDEEHMLFHILNRPQVVEQALKYPIDLEIKWGKCTVIDYIDRSEFNSRHCQESRKLIADEIRRRHNRSNC